MLRCCRCRWEYRVSRCSATDSDRGQVCSMEMGRARVLRRRTVRHRGRPRWGHVTGAYSHAAPTTPPPAASQIGRRAVSLRRPATGATVLRTWTHGHTDTRTGHSAPNTNRTVVVDVARQTDTINGPVAELTVARAPPTCRLAYDVVVHRVCDNCVQCESALWFFYSSARCFPPWCSSLASLQHLHHFATPLPALP